MDPSNGIPPPDDSRLIIDPNMAKARDSARDALSRASAFVMVAVIPGQGEVVISIVPDTLIFAIHGAASAVTSSMAQDLLSRKTAAAQQIRGE